MKKLFLSLGIVGQMICFSSCIGQNTNKTHLQEVKCEIYKLLRSFEEISASFDEFSLRFINKLSTKLESFECIETLSVFGIKLIVYEKKSVEDVILRLTNAILNKEYSDIDQDTNLYLAIYCSYATAILEKMSKKIEAF